MFAFGSRKKNPIISARYAMCGQWHAAALLVNTSPSYWDAATHTLYSTWLCLCDSYCTVHVSIILQIMLLGWCNSVNGCTIG
jgi:hypothetical protein